MLPHVTSSQEKSNKNVPKPSTCDSIGLKTKPSRDNLISSGNQVNTIWQTILPSTTLELTVGLYDQSTFTTKNSPRTVKGCIEILTRDYSNPGTTKSITRRDRTLFIQTHGTNNMTQRIKSHQTKRARTHVSRDNIQVSTDKTRRLVTKTRVTCSPKRPARTIRARTHIQSNTQQVHTQTTLLQQ